MKWKTKPKLHDGQKRSLERFAWLPVELTNGTTIWLEWYLDNQEVKRYNTGYYWTSMYRYQSAQVPKSRNQPPPPTSDHCAEHYAFNATCKHCIANRDTNNWPKPTAT